MEETQRRGAVRSESARAAILDAASALFAERGYEHLTMEGIAARAGVAKQTIYRWWPTKGDLIAECLIERRLLPDVVAAPYSGDLRADMIAWLDELVRFAHKPGQETLLISLVAAAAQNPDVGRRLNEQLGATSDLARRMSQAKEAGDLATDAPVEQIAEALIGAVLVRVLMRAPLDHDVSVAITDAVLGRSVTPVRS